jgi:hypothetical protein
MIYKLILWRGGLLRLLDQILMHILTPYLGSVLISCKLYVGIPRCLLLMLANNNCKIIIKCEVSHYIFLYLVHNWFGLYVSFRCRIWAERAGCTHLLEKGVEVLNTSYRLCSDHFDDKCYTSTERRRLLNYALPEIFAHDSGKTRHMCWIQRKARWFPILDQQSVPNCVLARDMKTKIAYQILFGKS